ncbi:hypothetical protein OUZ56_010563 [Daphnia magna]|uniref:Uncharacterized protein n=1 Tax=Daphnia magna TaxID=35525 RepID=A0ABR0AJ33_9CRUS|nr:hypothetical protein OUZ56_010563 [Daphnia magna]
MVGVAAERLVSPPNGQCRRTVGAAEWSVSPPNDFPPKKDGHQLLEADWVPYALINTDSENHNRCGK